MLRCSGSIRVRACLFDVLVEADAHVCGMQAAHRLDVVRGDLCGHRELIALSLGLGGWLVAMGVTGRRDLSLRSFVRTLGFGLHRLVLAEVVRSPFCFRPVALVLLRVDFATRFEQLFVLVLLHQFFAAGVQPLEAPQILLLVDVS